VSFHRYLFTMDLRGILGPLRGLLGPKIEEQGEDVLPQEINKYLKEDRAGKLSEKEFWKCTVGWCDVFPKGLVT